MRHGRTIKHTWTHFIRDPLQKCSVCCTSNIRSNKSTASTRLIRQTERQRCYIHTDAVGCATIMPGCFRAGVCRPCVETELTATKKSATDGDRSVTTLCRHKRAYDRIQLVVDSC